MTGRITAARVRLAEVDFHPHNVRVDLGDLRSLTESMAELELLHPVTLERRGSRFRVRDGHRRVAAAKALKWATIKALIHEDALADDDWLVAAVHVNTRRAGLDEHDRRRTILSLRDQGWEWDAIAGVFDTTAASVKRSAQPKPPARPTSPASAAAGRQNLPIPRRTIRDFTKAWAEHAQTNPVTTAQILAALADLIEGRPLGDTLPTASEPE